MEQSGYSDLKTPIEPETQENKRLVGRRGLLKALTAAGGSAVALTMLPNKWVKPVVEVGYLPAHAQGSSGPVGTVSNPTQNTNLTTCTNTGNTQMGNLYEFTLEYDHPTGGVVPGAAILHSYLFQPGGLAGSFTVTLTASHISGDGFTGSITYSVCMAFGTSTDLTTTLLIIDINGQQSNTTTFNSSKQAGAQAGQLGFVRKL